MELLRGYATPASFRLRDVGDFDPRDYPKGSRWFLAAGNSRQRNHTPIEMLPANDETAASVREWMVPGWQRSPNILVLRLRTNDPDRQLLTFDVVESLRGSYNDAQLRVFVSLYDQMFKSYVPGDALYIAGTFFSSYASATVFSLDPVSDAELPAIKRVLSSDPFGQLQEMLRWETRDMELIQTAWRFARAPIVAEVEVSRMWDEPSGAGGVHLTLAPVRVLRGEVRESLPVTSPGGTLIHAPPDRGLFYAGGHAYRGGEAMGQRFLAAGHGIGYHATVRLPATPENRRLVEFFLHQEPAVLRLLMSPSGPETSFETLGDDRDLFQRSVSLRASLTRRRWASLEVVDVRRGKDTWASLREVEFYGALGGTSRTNWDTVGVPTWDFRFRNELRVALVAG